MPTALRCASQPTPVNLLTGFLGSGKTTLLNGLLRREELVDTAVIVNELGDIAIDHLLINPIAQDILVLSSGCICCAMRDDLTECLSTLLTQRAGGQIPPFWRIIIETTGLAHPAPIVHTLSTDELLNGRLVLDSVLTTVDASNVFEQLEDHVVSRAQIEFADLVILTKTDIASDVESATARRCVAKLNPTASVLAITLGHAPPSLAIQPGGTDTRWRGLLPGRLKSDSFEGITHQDNIATVSLIARKALAVDRLVPWMHKLLNNRPGHILRLKGVVDLIGCPAPIAVHGVRSTLYPLARLSSWFGQTPMSRIVIIGHRLESADIEQSFREIAG